MFTKFCRNSIEEAAYYDITNYPMIYHLVLQECRYEFDLMLHEFVSAEDWWEDKTARALFEFDILSKTFIYSNVKTENPRFPLETVRLVETGDNSYNFAIPIEYFLRH